MLASQKQLLETRTSEYLNLGITADGEPRRAIPVPWELTGSAMNMRTPDLYLAPEDLQDAALMARLRQFHVLGCYIFTPLEDYSFLAGFPELWDVSIWHGQNLKDLSFMRSLPEWFMFYLEDAQLDTLDPLFPPEVPKERFRSYCLGFSGCRVGDNSAIERSGLFFSELLVLCPKGAGERSRWKLGRVGRRTYYEYDT